MSDSPLRLALVSHPDNLPARSEALRRVRGGAHAVRARAEPLGSEFS